MSSAPRDQLREVALPGVCLGVICMYVYIHSACLVCSTCADRHIHDVSVLCVVCVMRDACMCVLHMVDL